MVHFLWVTKSCPCQIIIIHCILLLDYLDHYLVCKYLGTLCWRVAKMSRNQVSYIQTTIQGKYYWILQTLKKIIIYIVVKTKMQQIPTLLITKLISKSKLWYNLTNSNLMHFKLPTNAYTVPKKSNNLFSKQTICLNWMMTLLFANVNSEVL